MNTTNTLRAIDVDLNYLAHYNTKGSHWYVNGPGKRFQAHAQYAMGKANPDAKERKSIGDKFKDWNESRTGKVHARQDAAVKATLENYNDGKNKGAAAVNGSTLGLNVGYGYSINKGDFGPLMYYGRNSDSAMSLANAYNNYVSRTKGQFNSKYGDAYSKSYKDNFNKYLDRYKGKTLLNYSDSYEARTLKQLDALSKNAIVAKYHMGTPNQDVPNAKEDRKAIKEMNQGAKQTAIASNAAIKSAKSNLKAAKQELQAAKLSRQANREALKVAKRDIKDYEADYKDHIKAKANRDTLRKDRYLIRSAKDSLKSDKARYKSDTSALKSAKTKVAGAKENLKSTKDIYGSVKKGTKAATIDAIIDSGKASGWNKAIRAANKFGYYTRNPSKTSNKLLKAAGKIRNTRVNAYYTAAYSQAYDRLMKAGGN